MGNLKSGTDALIFDLDGTLWSTVPLCTRAWNSILISHGLDLRLTESDTAGTMGMTAEQVRAKIFPGMEPEKAQRLIDGCFRVEIEMLLREGGSLYAGVAEGLESLANRYPLFLVSNCEVEYLDAFKQKTSLARWFTDFECHGRTRMGKGKNIKLVVQRNNLKNPVYVGDTLSDEKAADEAGVRFAYAAYGFGRSEKWDFKFLDFASLVKEFTA